jgi:hypothetical protein
VGAELVPAAIAPESFQAHEGLLAHRRPELTGAFETALVLTAGRFDRPGTHRMISQFPLLLGGIALLASVSGFEYFLVLHPVDVVLEIVDLGLDFLLLGFQQTGLEFGQSGNHRQGLVLTDLLQGRNRADRCPMHPSGFARWETRID